MSPWSPCVHQVGPEAAAALLAHGATLLPLPLPLPLLAQLRAESAAVLERSGAASQAPTSPSTSPPPPPPPPRAWTIHSTHTKLHTHTVPARRAAAPHHRPAPPHVHVPQASTLRAHVRRLELEWESATESAPPPPRAPPPASVFGARLRLPAGDSPALGGLLRLLRGVAEAAERDLDPRLTLQPHVPRLQPQVPRLQP